jgi:hypothetical protein
MKVLQFSLLFCFISSLAMQEASSIFSLDEKGIEEFKVSKKIFTEKNQNIKDASSNQFLAYFKDLTQKDNDQLRAFFNKQQSFIKELHTLVIKQPQYKKIYNEVTAEIDEGIYDDIKWKSWRKINSDVMIAVLKKKGFIFCYPSELFLQVNAKPSEEAINYYTAANFLVYYTRQIQRQKTGKDLPPIVIK